jgi:hypothetical protein
MVGKMHSQGSKASPATDKGLARDLRLPVFEEPLIEPWPMRMSWEEAIRSFTLTREHYMQHFDSPEKRLRDKNPAPFRLT